MYACFVISRTIGIASIDYALSAIEVTIKRITVMLTPELHMTLKLHSVAAGTTINDCVVAAIKSYLQYECNAVNRGSKKAND